MNVDLSLKKIWPNGTKWLEKQQNSILSAASIITVASMVSAITGLLLKRVLNYFFIDIPQSLEAFWLAFQIPDMMFQLIILGALSAAFIPIFTTYKNKDPKKAFKMSSIMMNLLLLVFMVVGVAVFVWAEELTRLRTGGEITNEQIMIVTKLTRLMIVAQFFFAISNFMTGILQSFQRFIVPAVAPIFYNLGILIGVILFHQQLGIYAAGVGVVIGAFLHMIVQFPLVLRLGFRYSPSLNFKYAGIRQFFSIMPPRVLAIGAGEIRKLMLGFFTTSVGNLSYLTMFYALSLMTVPIRLFGVPIGQASLPFLSEKSEDKQQHKFVNLVVESLHQIAFLSFPASVLLLILRIPAVRLVFGTSNFPWAATVATGKLVAVVSLSIAAQAMSQLLTRAFYALKDTYTPLKVAMFDLLVYVLLSAGLIFGLGWGAMGVAIATTLTGFIELLLLIIFLDRKLEGKFISRQLILPQIKIVAASFFMAVFLYLPFRILDTLVFNTAHTMELIALSVVTATVGMLVYLYFSVLFDIKQLDLVVRLLSNFKLAPKTLARSQEVVLDSAAEGEEI